MVFYLRVFFYWLLQIQPSEIISLSIAYGIINDIKRNNRRKTEKTMKIQEKELISMKLVLVQQVATIKSNCLVTSRLDIKALDNRKQRRMKSKKNARV